MLRINVGALDKSESLVSHIQGELLLNQHRNVSCDTTSETPQQGVEQSSHNVFQGESRYILNKVLLA